MSNQEERVTFRQSAVIVRMVQMLGALFCALDQLMREDDLLRTSKLESELHASILGCALELSPQSWRKIFKSCSTPVGLASRLPDISAVKQVPLHRLIGIC